MDSKANAALLALCLASAIAPPAAAERMLVTFTGIASGYLTFYNQPAIALDADRFTGVVVYDSDVGRLSRTAQTVGIDGGDRIADADPVVTAFLKIDGVQFDFGADLFYGSISHDFASGYVSYVSLNNFYIYSGLVIDLSGAAVPDVLDQAFGPLSGAGNFVYKNFHAQNGLVDEARANLTIERATVERLGLRPVPTTVPEPTTWALLIAGFFGAAGVLRGARRSRSRPAAHYETRPIGPA